MAREHRYADVPGMDVGRHRWVYDLLEKEDQLEDILGVRLREILGCGYFGCVVATDGPWVVKLTVDETEGPIWSAVEDVVTKVWGETGHYLAAWPRVREIVQLKPGVSVYGRELKLYAIVREAAAPAFAGGPYDPLHSTPETLRKLEIPERAIAQDYDPILEHHKSSPQIAKGSVMYDLLHAGNIGKMTRKKALEIGRNVEDLLETLRALQNYSVSGKEVRDLYTDYYSDQAEARESAVRHLIKSVTMDEVHMFMSELSDNEYAWPFAQLFTSLADDYIVLADVHALNIGWRQHRTIDKDTQPECLMVIDPGATPTVQRTVVEERMIANGRWLG